MHLFIILLCDLLAAGKISSHKASYYAFCFKMYNIQQLFVNSVHALPLDDFLTGTLIQMYN